MKVNTKKLMLMALILLPFEAIPHTMPSIYRPITAYPLCIIGAIYIVKSIREKKINKIDFDFIIFGIYTVIAGIMLSYFKFNSFSAFLDFLLTFIMGLLSFFGANYGFQKIRMGEKNNEEYICVVLTFLSKIYTYVLLIGFVELLCQIGILPFSLLKLIYTFTGGRQYNRVCLLSSEAAYASNHLILMAILFYFMIKKSKKKKYVIYISLTALIFIYNMSGMGLINVIAMFIIYIIISYLFVRNNKTIKFAIGLTLALLVGFQIIKVILPYMQGSYYIDRLINFTSIDKLLRTEGSAFIRIAYPYLAIMIFLNNIVFGIGAGNFCNMLEGQLNKYYPWAILQYDEVYSHVKLHVEQTGCLYTRLLAETGIVGFVLFMRPMLKIIKKFKYICDKQYINVLIIIVTFIFSSILQVDSFVYEIFWVMLGFMNNFTKIEVN